ncbi:MAG: hypothetical protein LQ352_005994 [Teloschistes flavicans]|nr:MAG: hypothetical protein LQ352_005994 [Teloschistes flavicans]
MVTFSHLPSDVVKPTLNFLLILEGIAQLFPDVHDFCAFYDPMSAQSVLTALDDLDNWITDNGPFDGCLGFSQGAALAAMLIIRQQNRQIPTFRFAVFICAAVPHDETALQAGKNRLLHPVLDGQVVKIPTAHIVGMKDPDLLSALELTQLCQERGKRIFDHGGGHDIPRTPKDITLQMATVVNEVMIKAEFVQ